MLNMSKSSDYDNGVDGASLLNFKYWLFLVTIVPSHVLKSQRFGSSIASEDLFNNIYLMKSN